MKTIIGVVVLITFLAVPAQAKLFGCYQRIYTAVELARHPDMQVAVIQLQITKLTGGPKPAGEISGKFRGEKTIVGNSIFCMDTGGSTYCQVEGDGGSFSVTEDAKGAVIEGASFSFDDEHAVGGKDEHEFHLFKQPDKACR